MTLCSPRCHSIDLRYQQRGEHTCSLLGTPTGVAAGFSGAFTGAETGATTEALAGPIRMIAAALLGALAGGTAGCVVAARQDRRGGQSLIGNLECNYC